MLLDDLLISAIVKNQNRFKSLYGFFCQLVLLDLSLYDCLMYVGDDFIWASRPSNKKVKKKGEKSKTKGLRSILLLHFLYKNPDTFL